MKLILTTVLIFLSIAAEAAETSSYIVCGKHQREQNTLTTSAGQKLELDSPIHGLPKAERIDQNPNPTICLFVDKMTETQKLKVNPFPASPDKVQPRAWSAVQCGDVVATSPGKYALVNNDKQIDLQLPEKTVIEPNSIYCAYGNILPKLNIQTGRLEWKVEQIGIEGRRSSGVTIGN